MQVDSVLSIPRPSLRSRIIHGFKWEFAGQIVNQFWRFASNLILTRLLVPEAFGIMGLVQVYLMAIDLLSDVGLRGSVIHHKRGDCPDFLNTVWTVKVIRGVMLWLITCIGAYPFAVLYEAPILIGLLPFAGLSAIIKGFASTSLLSASRHINTKWYVIVDFGSQMISSVVVIILAYLTHSIWALAAGWVIGATMYSYLSFRRKDIPRNRFRWDREAIRAISSFGIWAVPSSALTIIQQRGDRMVLGKVISKSDLGAYVIGSNLAIVPLTMFNRVNAAILQPTFAQLRTRKTGNTRSKIRRLRFAIVMCLMPIMTLLIVFGQKIVDSLYPSSFGTAGWFCSLTSLGVLVRISTDLGPIFQAHGDSKAHFKIVSVRTIALVVSIAAGYVLGGSVGQPANGVIYGAALAPLLSYPYQAYMYSRLNAWIPEVDVLGLIPVGLALLGQWHGII